MNVAKRDGEKRNVRRRDPKKKKTSLTRSDENAKTRSSQSEGNRTKA